MGGFLIGPAAVASYTISYAGRMQRILIIATGYEFCKQILRKPARKLGLSFLITLQKADS